MGNQWNLADYSNPRLIRAYGFVITQAKILPSVQILRANCYSVTLRLQLPSGLLSWILSNLDDLPAIQLFYIRLVICRPPGGAG